MRTKLLTVVGLVLAVGLMMGAATVGSKAPPFTLQDQNGNSVSLADYQDKIVVLEWFNPECPYVVRHHRAQTMIKLAEQNKGKDVVWLAINSTKGKDNAYNKQTVEKWKLPYLVLNDSSGDVGRAYGAKTTPHMYIIGKDGTLLYQGGIDDDPRGSKGESAVNYVSKALEEVLAGKPVSTPGSKPYGCSVKY